MPTSSASASPRYQHLAIEHAGQTWNGSWHQEGDVVYVSSAYGSKKEPIGRRLRSPEDLAKQLFRDVVLARLQSARLRGPS